MADCIFLEETAGELRLPALGVKKHLAKYYDELNISLQDFFLVAGKAKADQIVDEIIRMVKSSEDEAAGIAHES